MPQLLRISEAASLGLHACVVLARRAGRLVPAHELAEDFGASEAHLAKVMQRLGKAGLVRSTRGPRGGFRLAREAEGITLLEVYEAVEGPVEPVRCLLGRPVCRGMSRLFGDFVHEFDTRFRGYLATTTLGQLTAHEEIAHAGATDHHD